MQTSQTATPHDLQVMNIPTSILSSLQCSLCEGYLNSSPVMVTTVGAQICGKCFKILPPQEKAKYVRQTGLEAVAQMLIFPCRYYRGGCSFEVLFDGGADHERECPYRNIRFDLNESDRTSDNNDSANTDVSVGTQPENMVFNGSLTVLSQSKSDSSKELELKCLNGVKQNKRSKNNGLLKYTPETRGKDNYSMCLQDSQYIKPIEPISLSNTLENIYSDVKIKGGGEHPLNSQPEPIYDSIKSFPNRIRNCNNCGNNIANEVFYCQHGHDYCKYCRVNTCLHCPTHVSSTPRYYCKNFEQGCKERLIATDIFKHQTDCEFNSFRCPVPRCEWNGTLEMTILHVKREHPQQAVLSEEISKDSATTDDAWLMIAHDNLFKCKFFHYGTFVEFLVFYVGSHDKAAKFKYEIKVPFYSKSLKKSGDCLGWNGLSLEKGIGIQDSELRDLTRKERLCSKGFNFSLRIIYKT